METMINRKQLKNALEVLHKISGNKGFYGTSNVTYMDGFLYAQRGGMAGKIQMDLGDLPFQVHNKTFLELIKNSKNEPATIELIDDKVNIDQFSIQTIPFDQMEFQEGFKKFFVEKSEYLGGPDLLKKMIRVNYAVGHDINRAPLQYICVSWKHGAICASNGCIGSVQKIKKSYQPDLLIASDFVGLADYAFCGKNPRLPGMVSVWKTPDLLIFKTESGTFIQVQSDLKYPGGEFLATLADKTVDDPHCFKFEVNTEMMLHAFDRFKPLTKRTKATKEKDRAEPFYQLTFHKNALNIHVKNANGEAEEVYSLCEFDERITDLELLLNAEYLKGAFAALRESDKVTGYCLSACHSIIFSANMEEGFEAVMPIDPDYLARQREREAREAARAAEESEEKEDSENE